MLNDDETIKVITTAYNIKTGGQKRAVGKIIPAGDKPDGMLKVSYFGPFYTACNVLDIDADYQYALVSGSGLGLLWILSRGADVPDDIKARFLDTAARIGFDVAKLEWV